jgi:hypothetical protein
MGNVGGDKAESTAARAATTHYRNLGAAIAVYLGGYLLILSLTGSFPSVLAGLGGGEAALTTLLGGSLLFATLVTIGGYAISSASAGRTVIASIVLIVVVVVALVAMVARTSGGFGGALVWFTLANPYAMVVLSTGAGWLLVRGARAGWASLLLVGGLVPLPALLVLAHIAAPLALAVELLASGIVGMLILAAGKPLR